MVFNTFVFTIINTIGPWNHHHREYQGHQLHQSHRNHHRPQQGHRHHHIQHQNPRQVFTLKCEIQILLQYVHTGRSSYAK